MRALVLFVRTPRSMEVLDLGKTTSLQSGVRDEERISTTFHTPLVLDYLSASVTLSTGPMLIA